MLGLDSSEEETSE